MAERPTPKPSGSNRRIARTVAEVFGGKPQVIRYWDEPEKSWVDILSCAASPSPGTTCYSTLGLSDFPLYDGEEEYPARTEFVGACDSSFEHFANVMSTAAFNAINSQWFCCPGAIFPDVVAMYDDSLAVRHLFFVPPFMWEPDLKTMRLEDKTVAFLMAVPISEAECRLAEDKGVDELEALLEKHEVDVTDIRRASVL